MNTSHLPKECDLLKFSYESSLPVPWWLMIDNDCLSSNVIRLITIALAGQIMAPAITVYWQRRREGAISQIGHFPPQLKTETGIKQSEIIRLDRVLVTKPKQYRDRFLLKLLNIKSLSSILRLSVCYERSWNNYSIASAYIINKCISLKLPWLNHDPARICCCILNKILGLFYLFLESILCQEMLLMQHDLVW